MEILAILIPVLLLVMLACQHLCNMGEFGLLRDMLGMVRNDIATLQKRIAPQKRDTEVWCKPDVRTCCDATQPIADMEQIELARQRLKLLRQQMKSPRRPAEAQTVSGALVELAKEEGSAAEFLKQRIVCYEKQVHDLLRQAHIEEEMRQELGRKLTARDKRYDDLADQFKKVCDKSDVLELRVQRYERLLPDLRRYSALDALLRPGKAFTAEAAASVIRQGNTAAKDAQREEGQGSTAGCARQHHDSARNS